MKDFFKFARSNKNVDINGLKKYNEYNRLNMPAVLEERQQNIGSQDIFSRLMQDRIIFLGTEIDDESANIIQAQLMYLASVDPNKEISMYINSPGGVCTSGLAIYDTMQMIPCPISTTCIGYSASMAAILLAAGEKGRRFALPHSRIMIHQPSGGAIGQTSDILITAKEIENTRKELSNILANHTGQPLKKLMKDMDRDFWLSPEEAKAYGIVDNVLTGKRRF